MHALPRWRAAAPVAAQRPSRIPQAVACVAAAVLGHGALWLAVSSPTHAPAGPRVVVVQVRQVVMPAALPPSRAEPSLVAAAPKPPRAQAARPRPRAAASPQPPHATASPQPPRKATPPEPPAQAGGRDAASVSRVADVIDSEGSPPLAAAALPIYPTRIPPSAALTYTLQRGAAAGQASLDWRVDGDRYRLDLQATMSQGRPIDRRSQGGFDDAGLAPQRLADRRRGRDVRAANFQRERGLITFSGPRWEWPLHRGTQDRLSWLVQLVAIASAAPDALREGAALSMWVVGTRGALSAWRFEVRGREPSTASGDGVWWLVREPEHPYDVRVEVWLDPARGHWPVRMRQTQVPGGEPLEWLLRDGEPLESGPAARS